MFGAPTIEQLGPLTTGLYSPVTAPAQQVQQGGVITRDSAPKDFDMSQLNPGDNISGIHPTTLWWLGILLALVLVRVIQEVA